MTMIAFLQDKLKYATNKLDKHVLNYYVEMSNKYDNIKVFMNDIITHGCVSGVIGNLIYYSDTTLFYDKYEKEIDELADDIDSFSSVVISILNRHKLGNMAELKNSLAWFGFEETTRKLLAECKKQQC